MYNTCETATRKRKVNRLDRWDGLTAAAVAEASGRTIERNERNCRKLFSYEVWGSGTTSLTRKNAVEKNV